MIGWLLLTAMVADRAPPGRPTAQATETLKIDILVRPEPKCEAQNADEIVVCADKTDNETHRLRPIANAEIYETDESRAEFLISENVQMAAEVDSRNLGGGVTSKAIMARVKIKF